MYRGLPNIEQRSWQKKQLQSKVLREIDKNLQLKEFGVKVAEENVKSFSALLD